MHRYKCLHKIIICLFSLFMTEFFFNSKFQAISSILHVGALLVITVLLLCRRAIELCPWSFFGKNVIGQENAFTLWNSYWKRIFQLLLHPSANTTELLFTGLLIFCDVAISHNWHQIATFRIIRQKSGKIAKFEERTRKNLLLT